MPYRNKSLLSFIFITFLTFSLSCKKESSEHDPIAISVTPETLQIRFRIGEQLESLIFQFKYNGKTYSSEMRYTEYPSDANVEAIVGDTKLVAADATLNKFGTYALRSDKINTSTVFQVKYGPLSDDFVLSYYHKLTKEFNKITFAIGAQTEVLFVGNTDAFHNKYINAPVSFSALVENVLNSINDNAPSTPGNQPMNFRGWVEIIE